MQLHQSVKQLQKDEYVVFDTILHTIQCHKTRKQVYLRL